MSFLGELATEIWAEAAFHGDLERLEIANIRSELHEAGIIEISEATDVDLIRRLVQVALIFAESEDDRYREAAQRISTAMVRLAGANTADLFAVIQGRLLNFPALKTASGRGQPSKHVPMSLIYEFIGRRLGQTVIVGDNSEHIFTPFQLESWRFLADGRSGALSGPTSAGKSYVLLLHLVEQFRAGAISTAAFVVPTRALINQVSDDAVAALAERDVRDVTITSVPVDLSSDTAGKLLYVVTQERLDVLLIASPDLRLDLVVVDEAQMIADGSRGVLLESVIDRINTTPRRSQVVFSGPLIENPAYFGKLFNLDAFATSVSKRSPVTQKILFLDYVDQPVPKVSIKAQVGLESVQVGTVQLPSRLHGEIDRLSYMSFLFGRSGSTIVYAGGKSEAEKLATKIAIDLPADDACAAALAELIAFVKKHVHREYALAATLEKGAVSVN